MDCEESFATSTRAGVPPRLVWRAEGRGRDFYARFAREVESEELPPVIFSVAHYLRDFLSDRCEVFYGDGHLTCFKPRQDEPAPSR